MDTSAFIAGFDPLALTIILYTVPAVSEELSSDSIIYTRFKAAVESGKLQLRFPARNFLDKVQESSKVVGDILFLSDVDKQVLALALELETYKESPLIVTDDYSIQNVANQLGLRFTPLVTFGIRYRFSWTIYCPACYRKYPTDYQPKTCKICGTNLKRKPLRKVALDKRNPNTG